MVKFSSFSDLKAKIEAAVKNFEAANSRKINENNFGEHCEKLAKSLTELSSDFKILVSCLFVEKKPALICQFSSLFWDAERDGVCSVELELGTRVLLVTVYAVSLK